MVLIGCLEEHQAVDRDDAWLELEILAVAGDVIGALAFDFDGGNPRRHLLDRPDKARQQRRYRPRCGAGIARRHDPPLGVVGIALLAPAHREAIDLAAIDHERHRFGGIAKRDRQAA